MPRCDVCNHFVRTEAGVAIHKGLKHKKDAAQAGTPAAQPQAEPTQASPPQVRPPPDPPDQDIDDPDEPTYACDACHQVFTSSRALAAHRPSHAVEANLARLRPQHRRTVPEASATTTTNATNDNINRECDVWYCRFRNILNDVANFNCDCFNETYDLFAKFLFECNNRLPGPKNPDVVMYQRRKQGKLRNNATRQAKSSNPERTDKRARQRRRDDYDYQKGQYMYYNQRGKLVRMTMSCKTDKEGRCQVPMATLEAHYRDILSEPNNSTLEWYPNRNPTEDITVTVEEVSKAIRAMSSDTAAGYDRVLPRTVKELPVASTVKTIIEIILQTGQVPKGLSQGKTILIHKGGDPSIVGNWRPITLYSVVRRLIEKVLLWKLRDQVQLNPNQRGFAQGVPGVHVNAALINACLKQSKANKTECYVAFLDVSKAFDRIGHRHIDKCLEAEGVSRNLRSAVAALLTNNTIRLDTGKAKSAPIAIKRSVPQGGPLSPLLFNLAINHVYNEVCSPEFANNNGFKLFQDQPGLCLSGFADDSAVTSNSMQGIQRATEQVQFLLNQIGLDINPRKSSGIKVISGKVETGSIKLSGGEEIQCIDSDTEIKYLGCTFNSELVFDRKIIGTLTERLNTLISSPILRKDQKLNMINQYLLPMMTFALQAAPRRKIPKVDMVTLDKTIRNTIRSIVGLPTATATESFYAPRKLRGLGAVRCEWEVVIQHFAIAKRLATVPDDMFQRVYNCAEEMAACKSELNVQDDTARTIRNQLRQRAFDNWCAMDYQGVGVKHFATYPKGNQFMHNRANLTSSEWVASIKLNTNYANLAGVPGSDTRPTNRCRRCRNEIETIPHVLGACCFGLNRRNERHHQVKHRLRALLEEKGYECIDEAPCIDDYGSHRRIDILAFDTKSTKAYLIDPTVRYETNADLDTMVQLEKQSIYERCYDDLARRYPQYGAREYETIGLWMGARGCISTGLVNFFDRFRLDKRQLAGLAEMVLSASVRIIHHHIYSS